MAKPSSTLSLLILTLILALVTSPHQAESRLNAKYYSKTCPKFEDVARQVITDKQINTPTTAAGIIRLFFHDAIVTGLDASILIKSNPIHSHTAERDAQPNLSLPGDAFDVITRIKTAVELTCPGIVSCSDIIALAARDLLVMLGGPVYSVVYGRKDSLTSSIYSVKSESIPKPSMSMDTMIKIFESKGFSIREMVALSGAHTVGLSHCSEFASGIFNHTRSGYVTDKSYDPRFAAALRNACKNYKKDPTISVFNDISTPDNFDNMYFKNLQSGWGLLASDHALMNDKRTKGFVAEFANDQKKFFDAFAASMWKMSFVGVKVGRDGEVRRKCDAFNN